GGYTTFSSFEWETLSLVKHGGLWLGVFNAAGSVLLGYAAVWLGWLIGAKR
ncbi:MAG: CrcB family protein, partial [Acidobacteriia bacterium]|nr:CrcB family protein [Terriglobia bacterium]